MTDKLLAEYAKSNPNFYDGYWRSNPRRDAKCSQMLYGDSYRPYFQTNLKYGNVAPDGSILEEFSNIPKPMKNIQQIDTKNIRNNRNQKPSESINLAMRPNDMNLDSYSYLGQDGVESISCDGRKASVKLWDTETKMYDIDLPSIMKKKIIGDVQEIDAIHNARIKNTTFFGDMKHQHLGNTMRHLHYQVNPMMLDAHQRSFHSERFFQDH